MGQNSLNTGCQDWRLLQLMAAGLAVSLPRPCADLLASHAQAQCLPAAVSMIGLGLCRLLLLQPSLLQIAA